MVFIIKNKALQTTLFLLFKTDGSKIMLKDFEGVEFIEKPKVLQQL